MAIAVPLLMGAAGFGSTAIMATSLVMGVSGIGGKINKAASKVFGEDLVNIANIGGAAFMAFSGGFSSGAEGAMNGLDPANLSTATSEAAAATSAADSAAMAAADAAYIDANGLVATTTPAANMDGVLKQVGEAATKGGKFLADKWESMSPSTKSLLGKVGAGAAAGYMQGQQAEDDRKWRESRMGGSGLKQGDYVYGPRGGKGG